MADWTASMQQTFEFYTVDPISWANKDKVTTITECTIDRNNEETLGSARFTTTKELDECYIRVYLVTIQNGVTEKHPLGTYLVQTPETKYDGRMTSISMEAYTPLIELKDTKPPYGYTVLEGVNILSTAADLVEDNVRVPVVRASDQETMNGTFIADFDNDTWLSFISDLISNAKYHFDLDELGRILFAPDQRAEAMQPIWTFDDGNSSILYPEVTLQRDLYGIPNVVEVLYSNDEGFAFARVENNDESSPVSIPTRGRRVVYRVTNPDDLTIPSQAVINNYAEELLRELSTLEYTINYSHGYCPVRVGDCVMFNYDRADLKGIKAIVKSQSIKCTTGCQVSETAIFNTRLWG